MAAVTVGWVANSQAAIQTWKTATSGNWSDAASWTSGSVPLATDSPQFNTTGANGPESVYLNGNQSAAGLTFANTGATTLLGGSSGSPANNVLALTGSITVNSGAGTVTIGDPAAKVDVTTSSSQTDANNSSNLLTFANGISSSAATGTQTLTIGNSNGAGSGGVTVGGTIANGGTGGTIALTINAPLTTTRLLGANTYGGSTAITQGKLTYGSASAAGVSQSLGSISCANGADATVTSEKGSGTASLAFTTQTYNSGTLNYVVSGGTNGVDNQIVTTGVTGFVSKQAFFNGSDYAYRSGTNAYLRAPVYGTGGDSGFSIAGASLLPGVHNLITASITGQGTVANINTLKFSGTGAVNLTQSTSAQLGFGDTSGILRSGGGSTTISGGDINISSGKSCVVRADTVNDSLTINSRFTGGGSTFTKSGDGTVTLGGTNTFTGITYGNAGSLNIIGSTATSSYQANGTGVINLNAANAATGTTTIMAQNAGTVNINAPQNLTGAVTVDTNGTLGIGDDNALTATSITFKSGNLQAAGGAHATGATINFQNANNYTISGSNNLTMNGPLNWLGTQTLTVTNTGITTFGGTFTMRQLTDTTAQRTLTLNGPGTVRFTGPIINGGTLNGIMAFSGTGTVELNANNTYSGSTTIGVGQTVKLGHINGLGFGGITSVAGGTTVSSGGVLDLNGKGPVNEVITINGTGLSGAGALVNNDSVNTAVIGGGIAQISPGAAGSYTSVPAATITNGGGATATVSLGLIPASVNIDTSGGGTYSTAPNLTISGGGGSGATATVSLTGVVSIGNPGFGYTSAPTVAVSGGTLVSGSAWTATGNAVFGATAIQVTNPGTGTTGAVGVSFDSGTATATANLSGVVLGNAGSIGGPGNITINGPVTGIGILTKSGAGTLTLTNTCTFSGASTINSGSLVIGNGGTTGRLTATSGITNNGSLTINRGDAFTQASDLGIGAPISGTGSFTQAGGGTTTLTTVNTYSGTTTVAAGGLMVNGSIVGVPSSGAVSVSGGATLGGNGDGITTCVIGGAITIHSGGVLSPGPGIGMLTALGNVTFATGTTFAVELNDTSADLLNVAGTLDITGATLNITQLVPAAATAYVIGSYGTLVGSQFAAVIGLPDGYTLIYNYQGNHQIALVSSGSVSPYDTWVAGPFAHPFTDTAPMADPDGDGVSNLLEFVFGGDPTVADSTAILPTAAASGDDLVITFNRSTAALAAPAVTVTVQVSDDAASWPTGNDIVIGPASDPGPIGGTTASYTVTSNGAADTIVVTIPKGGSTRKFVRVVARQP